MKNQAWFGIGLAISAVIIAIAIAFKIVPALSRIVEAPVEIPKYAINKAAEAIGTWGQQKFTINTQNDRIEIKPISELALSRLRMRVVMDYRMLYMGSEKRIIAHQAFDLRVGVDLKSDISVIINRDKNEVHVTVRRLSLLSINPVEEKPTFLLREDGVLNKLTPEDSYELDKRMKNSVLSSPEIRDAFGVAKQSLESFFAGLFGMNGLKVTVDYEEERKG